jgi:glutamate 5-kinase
VGRGGSRSRRHAQQDRRCGDAGAWQAFVEQGASLLGVGVVRCEGEFEPGAAIELVGPDGAAFAKGIVGASAAELAGRPRGLEVVHRDRLVLY